MDEVPHHPHGGAFAHSELVACRDALLQIPVDQTRAQPSDAVLFALGELEIRHVAHVEVHGALLEAIADVAVAAATHGERQTRPACELHDSLDLPLVERKSYECRDPLLAKGVPRGEIVGEALVRAQYGTGDCSPQFLAEHLPGKPCSPRGRIREANLYRAEPILPLRPLQQGGLVVDHVAILSLALPHAAVELGNSHESVHRENRNKHNVRGLRATHGDRKR
mmetsp:Transcript_103539/g.259613  ORF Transcript_103539/g.259613 Transcript_103539/m.259613 type:complete len:223 (+) Transcript_103539:1203-1871(+)